MAVTIFFPTLKSLPTEVGSEEGSVKECELKSLRYTPKSWHAEGSL